VTTQAAVVRRFEQSLLHLKGTLLIAPYAGPASSQFKSRYCMDKEQYGGWCRLALKRAVAGSVSQVHCGGVSEKGWFRMVKTVTFPLEGGLP